MKVYAVLPEEGMAESLAVLQKLKIYTSSDQTTGQGAIAVLDVIEKGEQDRPALTLTFKERVGVL
ncbi:MAG TPA: hypothetical protein VOA88_01145 [Candidatus Dormibacteraeota bacterium]|nr:hypothetical protein [Candidatus Dormibacteraeota bacterium]